MSERESFWGSSLQGHADDVAQHDHGGGGQAGRDLLPHKVVQGGVGGNLGVLPRPLAHHIDGCSTGDLLYVSPTYFERGAPFDIRKASPGASPVSSSNVWQICLLIQYRATIAGFVAVQAWMRSHR